MEIIYDLNKMNKRIDDTIDQLKSLKKEINCPFNGMTTDKKRIKKFLDTDIEGYFLWHYPTNSVVIYSTEENDLHNYVEKKVGKWDNNTEKWQEYEVWHYFYENGELQEETYAW